MTGTSTPAPAPTGDEPDVLVSRHGRLGHIQLNRPTKRNAISDGLSHNRPQDGATDVGHEACQWR